MLGIEVEVWQSHFCYFEACQSLKPRYVVIGPGPGHPSQAHFSKKIIQNFAGRIPLLGICLGHQAVAELYGGTVERADFPMHGKTSQICHINEGIFKGIPQKFLATRYHSLIVRTLSSSSSLKVTAFTEKGEIMGLSHSTFALESLQFHPESIATEYGSFLLRNFLDISYL